ncbi:MAG: hypothetical protein AAF654_08575 [Myxococcota bacterium]
MSETEPLQAPSESSPTATPPPAKERHVALRVAAILSGAGLILGFVLPWLRFAEVATLSGLEIFISDNVMVRRSVGVVQQRMVVLVPLVGLVILGFGIRNGPGLRWVLLGGGILLVLFGAFAVLMIFFSVTSVGLWVVATALVLAIIVGALIKR